MTERVRVVIAVEEPMVGRILEHKLRREGYDVILTCRSAESSGIAFSEADVVLLDTRLCPAPRPAPRRGWLAIVDSRDGTAGHRAMHDGAAGLVRMPFKPTDVAAQVDTLLHMATA